MNIVLFILVLVVLILVHEFGHFSVAKLFGIKVEEFGVGFPPRLWAKKWGETTYSLNALLFGGFVRIFGESGEGESALSAEEQKRSFVHKPRLVQAAVLSAGIVFNILFAWLLVSVGYMAGTRASVDGTRFGVPTDAHVTVLEVLPGSPAAKVSIQPGDVIESLQTGTATLSKGASAKDVQAFIATHAEESLVITLVRDSITSTVLAKPIAGLSSDKKVIGVALDDIGTLRLPVHLALAQGAIQTKNMVVSTVTGTAAFLHSVFTGGASFSQVSGPIGITTLGAQTVATGLAATLLLAALISINLAVLNVLPIPGLDGGRLLFVLIEAIIRRPIPTKYSQWVTALGLGLLVLLMLVVSFHDIFTLVRPA